MSGHRAHNLQPFYFGWRFCVTCGLLALRNPVTARLLRTPCPGND